MANIRNVKLTDYECGGYTFNSNFDSGNLGRVELVRSPTPIPSTNTNSKEKLVDVEFNLWTRPDCYGTPFENQNRTWFYFSIRGGEKNQLIKFNVLNLNKQAKLFSQGMYPVIKHGNNGKWDRVKDKPVFYLTDESFVLSFFHRTLENIDDNLTYYAFTYPFTYTEQQDNLELYDRRYAKNEVKDDVYYYRELLINSYEDRRVDLVTITNFHGIEEKREDRMKNLFPDQTKLRCHSFRDKKVIFVSSRVHPGETPASFVLNGFLNLLLDRKSQVGNLLRRMYVFKIVPFLNPDGVYNGLYRSDTLGHNLNRVYLNPRLDTQPSIYAARKLISLDFRVATDEKGEKCFVEEKSNLFLYLDLHGHASKKGVFMYGNHLPNSHEAVECMLLPRLMSMNCHHFHFDACNFSERNMYLKGKRDGLSKEGSGRVAIYKSTGLIKSYTLESNYNMPKCVNILPPKGKEQSCKILNLIPPKFSPIIFEEVGRALGPSLLDLTNSNPCSRLINSEFRTLQGMRNALKNEISRGFTKTKNKRNSTSASVSQPSSSSSSTEPKDVPKENKVYNLQPSSSSSSSSHPQKLLKSSGSLNNNVTVVQQSSGVGNKMLGLKMKHQAKIPSFVRKDVAALTMKKKKILCETSGSSTISVQPVAVGLNQNQVPRKKIKVSNASTAQPYLAQTKGDSVNTTAIISANCSVTSSTNLPTELANFFLNTEFNDSTDAPCCSKTMSYQTKPSSPSSSCSTSSNGQLKITSFMPIKKHTKSKKMKFSKTTTATKKLGLKKQSKKLMTATKTIALSGGGGSGAVGGGNGGVTSSEVVVDDVTQINVNIVNTSSIPTSNSTLISSAGTSSTSKLLKKKKRTLKSETNLKRKKSRCCNKPLLH
ncbi:unnamed protein product [Diamesa serratosioi]